MVNLKITLNFKYTSIFYSNMGWIDSIFSKKTEEETVDFSDLEKWFGKKSKPDYEQMEKKAKDAFSEIEEITKRIRELLASLENAELQNPNIEPKLKQYMSGNRDNYIKQVKLMIDNLPGLSEHFPHQIQVALDAFTERSARSYAILQEFFAHEAKEIASEIRKIDIVSKEIDTFYRGQRILLLNEFKAKITELEERAKMKEELKQSTEKLEKETADLTAEIEELKKQVDEKSHSQESGQLKKLNDEKIVIDAKLRNIDFGFNDLFSPLKRALRKYARLAVANEALIESYAVSPLKTLLKDEELALVSILEDMKAKLGQLNFDSDEQKKISQRIDLFPKEKILKTIENYKLLEAQLIELQQKISEIKVADEIRKTQEQIINIKALIDRKQRMINDQKHKMESVDILAESEALKTLAANAFGIKLNIKL